MNLTISFEEDKELIAAFLNITSVLAISRAMQNFLTWFSFLLTGWIARGIDWFGLVSWISESRTPCFLMLFRHLFEKKTAGKK